MRSLALAVVAVAACTGAPPPASPAAAPAIGNQAPAAPPTHELLATLERTACFGRCPIYKLAVFRDGRVEYTGERFVKTTGTATWTLTPAEVAAIDALFTDAHYLALDDAYTSYEVTDMPSVVTSYRAAGRTKRVDHYLGDSHAPQSLGTLEANLDQLVHIQDHIGTEEERQRLGRP